MPGGDVIDDVDETRALRTNRIWSKGRVEYTFLAETFLPLYALDRGVLFLPLQVVGRGVCSAKPPRRIFRFAENVAGVAKKTAKPREVPPCGGVNLRSLGA